MAYRMKREKKQMEFYISLQEKMTPRLRTHIRLCSVGAYQRNVTNGTVLIDTREMASPSQLQIQLKNLVDNDWFLVLFQYVRAIVMSEYFRYHYSYWILNMAVPDHVTTSSIKIKT